jgi:serine/threonine protein kinase
MGEVYRARDSKLQRDVALNVLPEVFASDPDRIARFEREARTLTALNHRHLAGPYGVEETNRLRALALEFVEGETLADRFARGVIPLEVSVHSSQLRPVSFPLPLLGVLCPWRQ